MQGIWFIPSLIFGAVQAATIGNWQMFIFATLSTAMWPLSRWLKQHREFPLAGQVVFDGKDVWIGENRLPRREAFWRRAWHQVVFDGLAAQAAKSRQPELLSNALARGFAGAKPGSNWIGLAGEQDFEFNLFESGPHLIIIGATGTGKSELLRLLVEGWSRQRQIQLTLIDFKGGATLARFAPHFSVVDLVTDLEPEGLARVVRGLEEQLAERQLALSKTGVSTIEQHWQRGQKMPRRVVVIDELGEALRQHPRLGSALEQIAARGRSLGVHLVATNQSMIGISRTLLVNLRARIAIGEMDPIDLSQMGFRGRAEPQFSSKNWRRARLKTGAGFELDFQFPVGF